MSDLRRTAIGLVLALLAPASARADEPAAKEGKKPPRRTELHLTDVDLAEGYSQVGYLLQPGQRAESTTPGAPPRHQAACAQLQEWVKSEEDGWGTDGKLAKFFQECGRSEQARPRGVSRAATGVHDAWVRLTVFCGTLDFLEQNRLGNALFVRLAQAKAQYELEQLRRVSADERPAAVKIKGVETYTEMLGGCLDALERYSAAVKLPRRSARTISWGSEQLSEEEVDGRLVAEWEIRWGLPWAAPEADVAGLQIRIPGKPWAAAKAGVAWTEQTLVRAEGDQPVAVTLSGGRRTSVPPGPPRFACELVMEVGPELGDKVKGWIDELRKPDYEARAAAARKLAEAGRAIAGLLKGYAEDPDPEVRLRVREILAGFGKEGGGR